MNATFGLLLCPYCLLFNYLDQFRFVALCDLDNVNAWLQVLPHRYCLASLKTVALVMRK